MPTELTSSRFLVPETPMPFGTITPADGPLTHFEQIRPTLIKDVSARTQKEFSGDLDLLLGEAWYHERGRIKKNQRFNLERFFIRNRIQGDQKLWSHVHRGLLKSASEVNRHELLSSVVDHYAHEIGGHFNPKVYHFATRAIPWGFNWLLNAASVRQFMPWKTTESLQSRLRIYGEIEHLQKLSQKGTILLVPTHQSNLDSILIGYVIALMGLPPFSYGAGLNLFSNPVLRFFMSNLGAYTVDRQKSNLIYKATVKNYSSRILKEGIHSIFFPAGGRVRSGAIESHLKLGLLGTGLQAQIEKMKAGSPKPNVYVVPVVTSYHFVLEASSLVEDYLAQAGKHRFIGTDEAEPFFLFKLINFFWTMFAAQGDITVRVGKPLDIFGNFVDENGESLGPNGTRVDPRKWLTTRGELREDEQRDREYTMALGEKLVDRYHKENIVLTSHLVAFAFFRALRKQYPDLDLFRLLRLSKSQRSISFERFLQEAQFVHDLVKEAARLGELHLCEELKILATRAWIDDGARKIGIFHGSTVLKIKDGVVWSDDLNLLYYYRNRLTGYGFSPLRDSFERTRGEYDQKGFLV